MTVRANGDTYIGTNKKLMSGETERLIALSHELGHFNTGTYYHRRMASVYRVRYEREADLDSIRRILPTRDILRCVMRGNYSIRDIAEEMGFPEVFVQKAVDMYQRTEELPPRQKLAYLWE